MTIQINKGITIPTKRTRNMVQYDEIRKIVSIMDIGDSFLIPRELLNKGKNGKGVAQGIRQQLFQMFRRADKKCAIRQLDLEKLVFRCWRIE